MKRLSAYQCRSTVAAVMYCLGWRYESWGSNGTFMIRDGMRRSIPDPGYKSLEWWRKTVRMRNNVQL